MEGQVMAARTLCQVPMPSVPSPAVGSFSSSYPVHSCLLLHTYHAQGLPRFSLPTHALLHIWRLNQAGDQSFLAVTQFDSVPLPPGSLP